MWLFKVMRERGYGASVYTEASIDAQGKPLPWISYPAIEYILGLDLRDKLLFEFGSGNSTLFWGGLCKKVVSVEHNKAWFNKVIASAPSNVRLVLREDEESYLKAIDEYEMAYDIIVIDGGLNRRKMAEVALTKLAAGGVIILDNSDCHVRAAHLLRQAGLIQVDMTGFCPIGDYEDTTSFFFDRRFQIKSIERWLPRKSRWGMQHYVDE